MRFTTLLFALLLSFGILGSHGNLSSSPESAFPGESPSVKPLLRILPAFREEECDWAIRWDICLKCIRRDYRYAQKIHFFPSGQYREHGCYTEEKGFFLITNEKGEE
ncbi:hypothetical protein [Leptospira langatensis]|uniref:hypothetical protein n=1 Tax=Leptospira langatensis TaxID=2484983 RepID=UPI001FE352D0|nr:hypothetical protein [Leptospira langatensis]